jgi:hypothetical protein
MNPRVRVRTSVLHAPKLGQQAETSEDAWAVEAQSGLVSVADGASGSFESRRWAEVLTRSFVGGPPDGFSFGAFECWYRPCMVAWEREVLGHQPAPPATVAAPVAPVAPSASWYSNAAAERGAAATFVGLAVCLVPGRPIWRAMVVGDTNVFQVRDRELIFVGPLTSTAEFTLHPTLLHSRSVPVDPQSLVLLEGDYRPGDLLLVATDAMARFMLAEAMDRPGLLGELCSMRSERFLPGAARLVAGGRIDDDDLTVARVLIEEVPA